MRASPVACNLALHSLPSPHYVLPQAVQPGPRSQRLLKLILLASGGPSTGHGQRTRTDRGPVARQRHARRVQVTVRGRGGTPNCTICVFRSRPRRGSKHELPRPNTTNTNTTNSSCRRRALLHHLHQLLLQTGRRHRLLPHTKRQQNFVHHKALTLPAQSRNSIQQQNLLGRFYVFCPCSLYR